MNSKKLENRLRQNRLFFGSPRKPERIPDILNQLKEVWEKHPDMRLAQLIGNLQNLHGDLYHIEDQALIDKLKYLYADKP